MALADHILKQIEQCGYTTAVVREEKTLAFVAEPNVDIDPAKRGPRRRPADGSHRRQS